MHEPQLGQYLGRYRLDALLGEGGMALVYRATDTTDGREVAIKVVHPTLARDPAFVARFLREARVFARLQHPNILRLLDTGEQNATPYLVMPYVADGTLEDWLAQRHTLPEVLDLVRLVAAALDHAHERGVIHRDVKPGNVLIAADGTPLLADFGIAHAIGDSKLTATGMHIGSAIYMAPEQVQGVPLTGAVDQYALASMLYEALTGRSPYVMVPTDTSFSLMLRKLAQAPPPPTSLNPALPPACDAILLRGLAKEPERRFGNCTALVDALAQALTTPWAPMPVNVARQPANALPPPISATPPSISPTPPPFSPPAATSPPPGNVRPIRWIALGASLGLFFCLSVMIVGVIFVRANRDPSGGGPGGIRQDAGLTEASVARSVDEDSRPRGRATEFRTGEMVFITFRANQAKAGQYVDLKMYRNDSALALADARSTFDKDATYNGYFSYTPNAAGSYRVELYFSGESMPSQTMNFTVR